MSKMDHDPEPRSTPEVEHQIESEVREHDRELSATDYYSPRSRHASGSTGCTAGAGVRSCTVWLHAGRHHDPGTREFHKFLQAGE